MQFDDSDMKIAFDNSSKKLDASEGAASDFVREKENGNLEKARRLGIVLAHELTHESHGITLFGIGNFDNAETMMQRKILFSYIATQIIERLSPNSVVAKSALSSFYSELEQATSQTENHIKNDIAYSLYMLAEKEQSTDRFALGKVFAQLCGKPNDPIFIRYGYELSNYFTMHCTEQVLQAEMV